MSDAAQEVRLRTIYLGTQMLVLTDEEFSRLKEYFTKRGSTKAMTKDNAKHIIDSAPEDCVIEIASESARFCIRY